MAKYKMADDFDDNSKKAFITKEYEKLEERVRNATSRTQLASIIADAANLALIASQYGIDIGGVLELIATAVSKTVHYETEQIQSRDSNEGVISAEEQERIDKEQKVLGIYKAFDSFHEKHLGQQIERNENLGKALKAMEKGEDVDEETKKKLNRTPEELEEEKLRWQHIALTNRIAEEQQKHHTDEIKKIEELEEKINHLSKNHPDRILLADKKKYHEHHYDLAKVQEAKCTKQYRERDKEAKELIQCRKEAEKHNHQGNKELAAKLEEHFHNVHEVQPNETLAESAKKEAGKIRQNITNNNKRKVNDKQSATEQLDKKSKVVVNNKSKHSSQWEI